MAVNGTYEGPYRRVLLDGSVVTKQNVHLKGFDRHGKPVTYVSGFYTWFFDPNAEWIKDLENSY